MQNKKIFNQGFTLLELLVVVLIIGILASIALPQYNKAVEKSRGTQALTMLNAIVKSSEIFYLTNGRYATQFNELDIDIPFTGKEKGVYDAFVTDTISNGYWSIQLYNYSKQHAVYATRLTGKYKGSTFMWFWQGYQPSYPLRQFVCYERKGSGVAFQGNYGDFCKKIMHGQEIAPNSQMFKIPL